MISVGRGYTERVRKRLDNYGMIAKVVLFSVDTYYINPTFIKIMSEFFIFKSFQENKHSFFQITHFL